jgi:hypothetical protein
MHHPINARIEAPCSIVQQQPVSFYCIAYLSFNISASASYLATSVAVSVTSATTPKNLV